MIVIKNNYTEILVQGLIQAFYGWISIFIAWHHFYIQRIIIWLLTGFRVIPAIVMSSSDEEVSFLSLS